MKYVKVRAENYKDAMIKLKQEHGEDAIPISHNYVKEGGLFKSKFFARDVVELTAAVQDKKPRSGAAVPSRRLDVTVDDRTPVKTPVTARVQEIIERATQPQAAPEPDGFGRVLNRAMSTAVQTPLPPRAVEVEERPDFGASESDGGRETAGNGNRIERELDEIKRTLSAISNVNAQKSTRGHDSEEECYIRPLREILQQNDYDTEVQGGKGKFRQVDRESSLQRLMTINLLKRLESSIESFEISMDRTINYSHYSFKMIFANIIHNRYYFVCTS